MHVFNVLLMLAVLIYGLSFGFKNFFTRIVCIILQRPLMQSTFGKISDWTWFVSLVYVCFVLKYGTDKVVATLLGVV